MGVRGGLRVKLSGRKEKEERGKEQGARSRKVKPKRKELEAGARKT